MFKVIALAVITLSSLAQATDFSQLSNSEKLITFLTNNLAGRTFQSKRQSGTSSDETFVYSYQKLSTISSIGNFNHGVTFKITNQIDQTNTRIEDAVQIKKPRTTVLDCEIGERLSSNHLIGFCKTSTSSASDPVGDIYSARVLEISESKLVIRLRELFYSDVNPTEKNVRAIATDKDITFEVIDGSTKITEEVSIYDMDLDGANPVRERKPSDTLEIISTQVKEK